MMHFIEIDEKSMLRVAHSGFFFCHKDIRVMKKTVLLALQAPPDQELCKLNLMLQFSIMTPLYLWCV